MIEKYSLQRQAEASPTCIEMYNLFSSYYFVKITYFANEKVEKKGNKRMKQDCFENNTLPGPL